MPEGSKISLDLSFNDKFLGTSFMLNWNKTAPYSFLGTGDTSKSGSTSNLLTFSSNSIGKMSNVVTVYSVNSDDEQSLLGTYYDVDNINTTFTASSDVVSVYVDVQYNPSNLDLLSISSYNYFWLPLFFKLDLSGEILVDTSGVNTGLLKGIIQWLKNILNAILALPEQIANKVIEGVKSLFVPSAEDLSGVFETATSKLEDRLGFIAQITTWLFDMFQSIISSSVAINDSITVPKLAIPWTNMPDWASVSGDEIVIWDEMSVKVIPEGAEDLQTFVKLITSLWAVLSLIACCIDSYHDFVGDSPIYRNSPERMEQKKVAQNFANEGIRRYKKR